MISSIGVTAVFSARMRFSAITAGSASALAYRRVVYQHQRDVLLSVQYSGRLQSLYRELGSAGVDDRGGHRDHLGACQGTPPGSAAPDHLRQRAAVHCQRLQGIHSGLGHDPRQNFTLLSPIERKNRTLAQLAKRRLVFVLRGLREVGNAPIQFDGRFSGTTLDVDAAASALKLFAQSTPEPFDLF